MIKLKTAQELKNAGLEWNMELGDFLYYEADGNWKLSIIDLGDIHDSMGAAQECCEDGQWIFVPRLDQLLAEIERRGYWWNLLKQDNGYLVVVGNERHTEGFAPADTPEEAAAQALLWILWQEVAHD